MRLQFRRDPDELGPIRVELRGVIVAWRQRLELAHVFEVLGSSARAFVDQQGLATRHSESDAVDFHVPAPDPGVVELDAGDARENVDAPWREPELVDRAGMSEVPGREPVRRQRCPERSQRHKQPVRVLTVGSNEDVEIARAANDPVNGERMRTNDEELDAGLAERLDEIREVPR